MIMKSADYQYAPKEGFVLTHFLTVADVKRSAAYQTSLDDLLDAFRLACLNYEIPRNSP
jgi:hypothetical protein